MNRLTAAVVFTSLAGLLTACGQGAPLGDGKRGAAKAAYTAMRPAADSDSGSSWNPLSAAGQPVDVSLSTTVSGKSSGTATVALDVSTSSSGSATDVGLRKNITYNEFSDDGKTRYNGSLKVELLVATDSNSASVKLKAQGRVTLSGEVEDVLDIDTVIEVAATSYDSGAASASVRLNGHITTRSGRYDYVNESVAIDTRSDLPADNASNNP